MTNFRKVKADFSILKTQTQMVKSVSCDNLTRNPQVRKHLGILFGGGKCQKWQMI